MATPQVICSWLIGFLVFQSSPTSAGNYDDYLRRLIQLNNAARYEYTRENPGGEYVLDHISSPEFLNSHRALREYNEKEFTQRDWDEFMESLSFADKASAHPLEVATKLMHSAPWTSFSENNKTPTLNRRIEVAPQNHLWGEHRVSGGSSESGRWMEYAVLGAHAQDDEDEIYDEDESARPIENTEDDLFEHKNVNKEHATDVKWDNLPAYCSPPNPCPIGYDQNSLTTPCDENIPSTKDFNRAWILRSIENGECSCDTEHMESCVEDKFDGENIELEFPEYFQLSRSEEVTRSGNPYLHGHKRSRLVAKKTNRRTKRKAETMELNPFIQGQRLSHVVKKNWPLK